MLAMTDDRSENPDDVMARAVAPTPDLPTLQARLVRMADLLEAKLRAAGMFDGPDGREVADLREAATRAAHYDSVVSAWTAHKEMMGALGQHLLDAHKPGEVDEEAVAILDGYHVGAREVAGGVQGEPGETTLEAALRLLKLAHQRGAFAAANPPAEPGWTGGDVIDASPTIRCWPAAGVVFMGPDGPVLSIDPMDGGNVALVHLGDVVEYKRSSDFDLLMLKHKAVMRKVAESLAPAKETP